MGPNCGVRVVAHTVGTGPGASGPSLGIQTGPTVTPDWGHGAGAPHGSY